MSCNVVMDMPDSAVSFFTRNGTRSRAELGAIFVAFMKDRMGYVDEEPANDVIMVPVKPEPKKKYDLSCFFGKAKLSGDPVAFQRSIRDEW